MMRFFSPPRISSATTVVGSLLTAVLLLPGCGPKPGQPPAHSPFLPSLAVGVQTVQPRSQALTEAVVGTVQARQHATLEAKISGRIDQFPVVVGQRVKAGELIARLDAVEMSARLDAAEAAAEQAGRDAGRVKALFQEQAATRADNETAQARQRAAQAAVAEARAMRSYLDVVAPFDGVIAGKFAQVGDFAAPGKPLVALEDSSVLQLEADIPQSLAARIRPADRLAVVVDGLAGELTGQVSELAPALDPGSRTLRVKLTLPSPSGLSSGQFARLLVPVGNGDTLRVPAAALLARGQLELVFVVVDRHAVMHLVKSGQRTGAEVEILAGLHAGDVIVVSDPAQLTDGQPVEVK